GEVGEVQRFAGTVDTVLAPAMTLGKTDADAVFIPLGGAVLRAAAPSLGTAGLNRDKVKLLGTGIWNDPANIQEPTLTGAWFAAPDPKGEMSLDDKYRGAFGANPPALAALSYDAIALVGVLAKGEPYKRFTRQALTDPNGFSGVEGIFRFAPDGTAQR